MPYKKEDDKWYVLLEEQGETGFGECGPFDTQELALSKLFNYHSWLVAMDAN